MQLVPTQPKGIMKRYKVNFIGNRQAVIFEFSVLIFAANTEQAVYKATNEINVLCGTLVEYSSITEVEMPINPEDI